MGPKGKSKSEAVAVEPVLEGARFATIEIGLSEDSCKVLVNLNCRLDIILDACRNQLLKQLNEKINSIKSDQAMGVTIGSSGLEAISEKIQKLSELPSKLQSALVQELELQDYAAGALVSCKSNLEKGAYNVLQPTGAYRLGSINSETNEFVCFTVIDQAQLEAASPAARGQSAKKK